jgi:hypothetical protein
VWNGANNAIIVGAVVDNDNETTEMSAFDESSTIVADMDDVAMTPREDDTLYAAAAATADKVDTAAAAAAAANNNNSVVAEAAPVAFDDSMNMNVDDDAPLGTYTREERRAKVLRYREKRQMRNYDKTTRYQVRKTFACKRVRVGGRFVSAATTAAAPAPAAAAAPAAVQAPVAVATAEGVEVNEAAKADALFQRRQERAIRDKRRRISR